MRHLCATIRLALIPVRLRWTLWAVLLAAVPVWAADAPPKTCTPESCAPGLAHGPPEIQFGSPRADRGTPALAARRNWPAHVGPAPPVLRAPIPRVPLVIGRPTQPLRGPVRKVQFDLLDSPRNAAGCAQESSCPTGEVSRTEPQPTEQKKHVDPIRRVQYDLLDAPKNSGGFLQQLNRPLNELRQEAANQGELDRSRTNQPNLRRADGTDSATRRSSPHWTSKPAYQLNTNIGLPAGNLPRNYAAERNDSRPALAAPTRGQVPINYCWASTSLAHWPLYFEEVNLERYGYGCHPCLQPFCSGAHFFVGVPMLPYCMATDCPYKCQYTLGHYRPGDCVPRRRNCVGWNGRGAFTQTAAITALIFILP